MYDKWVSTVKFRLVLILLVCLMLGALVLYISESILWTIVAVVTVFVLLIKILISVNQRRSKKVESLLRSVASVKTNAHPYVENEEKWLKGFCKYGTSTLLVWIDGKNDYLEIFFCGSPKSGTIGLSWEIFQNVIVLESEYDGLFAKVYLNEPDDFILVSWSKDFEQFLPESSGLSYQ